MRPLPGTGVHRFYTHSCEYLWSRLFPESASRGFPLCCHERDSPPPRKMSLIALQGAPPASKLAPLLRANFVFLQLCRILCFFFASKGFPHQNSLPPSRAKFVFFLMYEVCCAVSADELRFRVRGASGLGPLLPQSGVGKGLLLPLEGDVCHEAGWQAIITWVTPRHNPGCHVRPTPDMNACQSSKQSTSVSSLLGNGKLPRAHVGPTSFACWRPPSLFTRSSRCALVSGWSEPELESTTMKRRWFRRSAMPRQGWIAFQLLFAPHKAQDTSHSCEASSLEHGNCTQAGELVSSSGNFLHPCCGFQTPDASASVAHVLAENWPTPLASTDRTELSYLGWELICTRQEFGSYPCQDPCLPSAST